MERWYALTMPARYRAAIRSIYEARCDPRSPCAVQAGELIALLETGTNDEEVWMEEAIALLDQPDCFLSQRRTPTLALTTLNEALLKTQYDRTMKHERDSMQRVIARLEKLEARLLLLTESATKNKKKDDDEIKEALLRHTGQGIRLLTLRRNAREW